MISRKKDMDPQSNLSNHSPENSKNPPSATVDEDKKYNSYYGFSQDPFKLTSDPRFLFLAEGHREALASMIYGINERKGFILISGEAGIGKSVLIQELSNSLGPRVRVVVLPPTDITIEQMLIEVLLKLGLPVSVQEKGSLVHQLNNTLIQMLARDENLVIIVDEAQKLSRDTLEELRLLSNLETSNAKLVQIVLVGRPEIEAKLDSKDLRQLRQRIVVRKKIPPLTEEECRRYIDHRLNIAGSASSEVFTPGTVSLISRYSKGLPRRINIICDQALETGYRLSKRRIDASIVKRAIRRPPSGKIILILVCLGIGIFLGREYLSTPPGERGSKPSRQQAIFPGKVTTSAPEAQTPTRPLSKDIPGPASEDKWPSAPPPKPTLFPSETVPRSKAKEELKNTIKVKPGTTLSALCKISYNLVNSTLIEKILEFNPEITNPDLIRVGQEIKIPEITETSLVIESSPDTYEVHLGTFERAEDAGRYRDEVALRGKKIEVIPLRIPPSGTWYRVVAGKFHTREEALKMIHILKEKSLLPAFSPPPKD